jgi:signal transduction histidine kinase
MTAIGLIIHNLKSNYEEKLAQEQKKVRVVPKTMTSDIYTAQIEEKFHRLLMHNLRNPIGNILDSAELIKDVPLNVLEESLSTSGKISDYASKLIDLKKLEIGKVEVLLEEIDFESIFRSRLRIYENTALKNAVMFEEKQASNIPKISSDKNLLFKAIDYVFFSVLKFTKEQTGIITVSTVLNAKERELFITITNNAPKIGKKYENLIFERFADIKDASDNFIFNTSVELAIAKFALTHLDCELLFDINYKDTNVFNIIIPIKSSEEIT